MRDRTGWVRADRARPWDSAERCWGRPLRCNGLAKLLDLASGHDKWPGPVIWWLDRIHFCSSKFIFNFLNDWEFSLGCKYAGTYKGKSLDCDMIATAASYRIITACIQGTWTRKKIDITVWGLCNLRGIFVAVPTMVIAEGSNGTLSRLRVEAFVPETSSCTL